MEFQFKEDGEERDYGEEQDGEYGEYAGYGEYEEDEVGWNIRKLQHFNFIHGKNRTNRSIFY